MKQSRKFNSIINRKSYYYLFVSLVVYVFIAFSILSDLTFDLLRPALFSEVFWDMWHRLLVGDVTISPEIISWEAFIVNGKTLAYWLPTPALVRGVLSLFGLGKYPIPSFLLATTVFCIACFFTWREILLLVQKSDNAVYFAPLMFFLTPIVSLFAQTSVYWESIVWSLALFMAEMALLISILRKDSVGKRYAFVIVAILCLFTRSTYTVATVIAFFLLLTIDVIKKQPFNGRKTIQVTIFLVGLFSLAMLNCARWGNMFEFGPVTKNANFLNNERGRLAALHSPLSLDRVPDAWSYYFLPHQGNFSYSPPYITGAPHTSNVYCDYHESAYSIPILLPLLFVLSILGLLIILRKAYYRSIVLLLPLGVALVPGILILSFMAMALRYRGEFFTIMILLSMISVAHIIGYVKNRFLIYFISTVLFFMSLVFVGNGLLVERFGWFGCSPNYSLAVCKIYSKSFIYMRIQAYVEQSGK